ncbi:MAG: hypothetical protein M3P33_00980, partial [bacterium]|nr:hypothetical protein [bacterium]
MEDRDSNDGSYDRGSIMNLESIDPVISDDTRPAVTFSVALMATLQDQLVGWQLYYESIKNNALELSAKVNRVNLLAENSIQMVTVAILLMQTPEVNQHASKHLNDAPDNRIEHVRDIEKDHPYLGTAPNLSIPTNEPERPRVDQQLKDDLSIRDRTYNEPEKLNVGEQDDEHNIEEQSFRDKVHTQLDQPTESQESYSKSDLLTTDEQYKKYGPYALAGPSLVSDKVMYALVSQYRNNDDEDEGIAEAIIRYADKYNLNVEVVATAFMIQEGSFGAVTGSKSAAYN